MQTAGFTPVHFIFAKRFSWGVDPNHDIVVKILDHIKVVRVHPAFSLSCQVESQDGHQLVVECFGTLEILNRDLDVGVFMVVSRFFNRVDFLEDEGQTERIKLIYTAGLTIGSEKAVSIWKLDFDRVGIDYRWGNGGFQGIGFNLGFPF